jgi:hypothetical protein
MTAGERSKFTLDEVERMYGVLETMAQQVDRAPGKSRRIIRCRMRSQ